MRPRHRRIGSDRSRDRNEAVPEQILTGRQTIVVVARSAHSQIGVPVPFGLEPVVLGGNHPNARRHNGDTRNSPGQPGGWQSPTHTPRRLALQLTETARGR